MLLAVSKNGGAGLYQGLEGRKATTRSPKKQPLGAKGTSNLVLYPDLTQPGDYITFCGWRVQLEGLDSRSVL